MDNMLPWERATPHYERVMPIKKPEMSPWERVMTALEHKQTDRTPFSLGFGVNLSAKKELQAYLRFSNMEEVDAYLLSFSDIRWAEVKYIGPTTRCASLHDGSRTDIWGVERSPVCYGLGFYDEISRYPLAGVNDINDLNGYMWPSPDWIDTGDVVNFIDAINAGYSDKRDGVCASAQAGNCVKKRIKACTDRRGKKRVNAQIGNCANKHNGARANRRDRKYTICIGNGNIFETAWYLRGFAQTLEDLILHPELSWEIMTRVTDFYCAYFTKILQAAEGMIDIVFTADDIGQQNGLIMSMKLWEKMIKPHHVRLNKLLHEYGVKIMYHSDGAVMEAIPGLIDMGVDILEALQFDAAGMDPAAMKQKYGDKLCFHGGVSVQKTLPFGAPETVRREVCDRISVLGKNGGYILAPSHAIQAGTPPENIVAFLDAAMKR